MADLKKLLHALITELAQRRAIKDLIEEMEHDPHTLSDIGLTLEEFAAAQWEAHQRDGALRLYLADASANRSSPANGRGRSGSYLGRAFR